MDGKDGKTVLITGGAGFIGCAISGRLVHAFDRIVVVDNLHPQIHEDRERPLGLDPRAELIVADVTEAATWNQILPAIDPDVVIHLAAETGTGQSLHEATRHATANVVGTTQLLDALVRHAKLPKRIVLSSSRAIYGEGAWRRSNGSLFYPGQRTSETLSRGQWDFPSAEPTPMQADNVAPAPVSVYGATKLAQENILQSWTRAQGVECAILRLQNVYGPGQSLINPYTGIMSLFCRMAMANRSIPLFEDGRVRRDFVFIDDVATAIVAAATALETPVDPLDIGSGNYQTLSMAAELIAQRYGAPSPHVTGQYRQGDVRHAWADISKACEVLNWEPQYDLAEGIYRLAEWIETQPRVPAA